MRASVFGVIGAGAVALAFALPVQSSAAVSGRPKCGGHGWLLGALDTTSHIYGQDVDKPAQADRGNPKIPWPGAPGVNQNGTVESDMRTNGEASVTGQFVVDTMGCIDSSTFKVVEATDSSFATEVEKMLPQLHYEPAQKDKHKVKSWVVWKFVFFRKNGAVLPTGI